MTSRFRVSSVHGGDEINEDNPSTDAVTITLPPPKDEGERIPLCEQHSPLALYEEDYEKGGRQKIGQMLKNFGGYNETLPTSEEMETSSKKAAQLGTLMGVFFPCLQNIFGVLFFIRLSWIIGTAGILQGLLVVITCASVTLLTSISLSAIATNGVVSGGGPYYMISRNLGPELGGAVGILFYLGTTIAASMYITGAVEIFLLYIYPSGKMFDDIFHNFRLFGTGILLLLGLIVLAGVRIVNKFALPVVIAVLICISSVFVGVFVRINGSDHLKFCMVGDRPVDLVGYMEKNLLSTPPSCTPDGLTPLFCNSNGTCDVYFNRVKNYQQWKGAQMPAIREERGIKGLASGVFFDNLWPKFMREGLVLSKDPKEKLLQRNTPYWYLFSDMITSYMVLVGVFFPSVTGIMAGSNRSGNLKDAGKSIPVGTLAATLITSTVYISAVLLVGGSVSEMLLRDKLGSSALGKLTMAQLAWPSPELIVFGSLAATLGAGLQSLTGAPRLLQAIAADDVIPFLAPFREVDRRGEPLRAIFITLLISELGILIAVIESIAALITQFFLMCYLGVNTACALQSLLKAPGWRPGFKYFHWSLSLVGAFLCIAVMFISAWHFALIAIFIGAGVYKYIEYIGAQKEWGDGIRGLGLAAARFALLNLEEKDEHSRNWRPQLLVIMDGVEGESVEGVLSVTSQLKAGKGLTMVAQCIKGDFTVDSEDAEQVKEAMKEKMKQHRIRGFSDVLMTGNIEEGLSSLIQIAGLGGLRHNSVLLSWPQDWASTHFGHRFVSLVRATSAAHCAMIVTKGSENFPTNKERMNGFIDVWWVVHDGGLLMLLPFLLKQHKVWRSCSLRLFVIATIEENNVQMKNDLQRFLYQLRISAQVNVIEMPDSDISDYTYERTLKMEERSRILQSIRSKKSVVETDLQMHMDDVTRERKLSKINEEDTKIIAESHLKDSDSGDEPAQVSERPNLEVVIEDETKDEDDEDEKPAKNNGRGVRFSEEDVLPIDNGQPMKEPKATDLMRRRRRYNVHKMHTAVKLNELMRSHSSDAKLVVVNLPGAPNSEGESFYMDFIEALTESLHRVLLVRGTGAEVVTIYS
ncbi:kcc-2 [Pristionchus pacificus]|uniref:Kcc-2 n=1 Tax=Pristionchus pacificus TaxID=54126 RepID=A0A2A6BEE6_PRIPA|nr:kcc-2 [Pristionchus pacificus]|eukprot:PDM64226.1 kcc-2 [Pristionchus pacificus]